MCSPKEAEVKIKEIKEKVETAHQELKDKFSLVESLLKQAQ